MMPSPADLHYFLEIAQTSNLSRASERLGVTQPSLTLAIQRLENAVGTPLFLRSKRGVTLTQAGRQLLAHARELSQRWETVRSSALASTHEIQGSYTLGCHSSVALYSLPGFLPALLEAHPLLEVKLVHDLSRRIAERVVQLEVDLGIVVNPVRHPDLVIRKLCDDEVTLWVGAGSRKVQDPHSGEAVLLCEPDLLQTQDILKKLKKSGLRYRRILASSNLEVITELTASGAGIGILPGRVAGRGGKKLSRLEKAPVFRDEVSLLYRVENKPIRAIQEIVEKAARAFQNA